MSGFQAENLTNNIVACFLCLLSCQVCQWIQGRPTALLALLTNEKSTYLHTDTNVDVEKKIHLTD